MNKDNYIFVFWLGLLVLLSALSTYLLNTRGFGPGVFAVSLCGLGIAAKILIMKKKVRGNIKLALRALANNEPMVGFAQDDLLSLDVERVREQLHQSRAKIQGQNQFLQAMLIHMDSAIMVLNSENNVIHSNPALGRLLGIVPKNLEHDGMEELRKLISNCRQNVRTIVNWKRGEKSDVLAVRVSLSAIQGEPLKVVSLQSIQKELDSKEQQTYKDLSRVLTHEIGNSIMPMAMLSDSCISQLSDSNSLSEQDRKDVLDAMSIIAKRANHLQTFIQSFAQLNRLPSPTLQRIEMNLLLEQVLSLYQEQCKQSSVALTLSCECDEHWQMADKHQIEQVLVNLIKNALDAICHHSGSLIVVRVYRNQDNQLIIEVQDDGPGVADDMVDSIFVPHFTTKSDGTGVGLSLSKQIMLNHGGDLQFVHLNNGSKGACFRLTF